jgi:hypothetical protein
MFEEKAPERFIAPMNRASEKIVANFLNVNSKFFVFLDGRLASIDSSATA